MLSLNSPLLPLLSFSISENFVSTFKIYSKVKHLSSSLYTLSKAITKISLVVIQPPKWKCGFHTCPSSVYSLKSYWNISLKIQLITCHSSAQTQSKSQLSLSHWSHPLLHSTELMHFQNTLLTLLYSIYHILKYLMIYNYIIVYNYMCVCVCIIYFIPSPPTGGEKENSSREGSVTDFFTGVY